MENPLLPSLSPEQNSLMQFIKVNLDAHCMKRGNQQTKRDGGKFN
jgi:hypothetical protein